VNAIKQQDIHEGMHTVAARLGHPPGAREYRDSRPRLHAEASAQGQRLRLPSYQTIHRRYPHWDDALISVGLQPLGGPQKRRGSPGGRRITATADLCVAAVNAARQVLGDPLSSEAYKRWRASEIRRDPTMSYYLPSVSAIWRRFGGWLNAVHAALEAEGGR
jgi:hypothetical protein